MLVRGRPAPQPAEADVAAGPCGARGPPEPPGGHEGLPAPGAALRPPGGGGGGGGGGRPRPPAPERRRALQGELARHRVQPGGCAEGAGRALGGGKRGEHSPPGSPQPVLVLPGCPGPPPRSAVLLPGWRRFKSLSGSRVICVFVCFKPTTGVLYKEDNYIIMTTVDKEKYKCILPLIASGNEVSSALFVSINCRRVLAASVLVKPPSLCDGE